VFKRVVDASEKRIGLKRWALTTTVRGLRAEWSRWVAIFERRLAKTREKIWPRHLSLCYPMQQSQAILRCQPRHICSA
jgi:hypothetical protein